MNEFKGIITINVMEQNTGHTIVFIFICIFIIYLFYTCMLHNKNRIRTELTELETIENDYQMSELDNNTIISKVNIDMECPICLDPLNNGHDVRTLRCFHLYHVKCIDPWHLQNGKCPECLIEIV